MKKLIVFFSILLLGIDQFIKYLVINNLEISKSVGIINNFLYLTFVKNEGGAFSILSGNRWFFVIMGVIALIFLIRIIVVDKKIIKFDIVSYSLIVGGILGNLIDRIFYGSVIDYIDIYIFGYNAPIFNFADICIVLGACMIIYTLVVKGDSYEDNNSRKRIK